MDQNNKKKNKKKQLNRPRGAPPPLSLLSKETQKKSKEKTDPEVACTPSFSVVQRSPKEDITSSFLCLPKKAKREQKSAELEVFPLACASHERGPTASPPLLSAVLRPDKKIEK